MVRDVLPEQASKMRFVQDYHLVEHLLAGTSDPAFRCTVLPGHPVRRAGRLRADGFDDTDDFCGEERVAVEDELPRRGVERECLADLLHDPGRGRVLGDVTMDDLRSQGRSRGCVAWSRDCARLWPEGQRSRRGWGCGELQEPNLPEVVTTRGAGAAPARRKARPAGRGHRRECEGPRRSCVEERGQPAAGGGTGSDLPRRT